MGRFTMTKPALSAVTFGVFLLLVAGLAASRCDRTTRHPSAIVVTDSTSADSVNTRKKRVPKARKSKEKKQNPPPIERNHLDETVD